MEVEGTRQNYQKVLDQTLERLQREGQVPTLLLHSCCAPCSSYVLEYLSQYFRVTVFYYNPNIFPETEYWKRVEEQQKLIQEMPCVYPVSFQQGDYDRSVFHEAVRGQEEIPEGGERCFRCYRLRLQAAAECAKQEGFDYFTTTLSISPMKNAQVLNALGQEIGQKCGVRYLCSDFKKRDGYRRSIELSGVYGLYRQDYCGCEFSLRERKNRAKS
ncbi:MAG: epoxyqueuosine reductase QueH [Hespellia sp.]|nr:epoxyqueuosine reductase QueH [Hespellia sp.]